MIQNLPNYYEFFIFLIILTSSLSIPLKTSKIVKYKNADIKINIKRFKSLNSQINNPIINELIIILIESFINPLPLVMYPNR